MANHSPTPQRTSTNVRIHSEGGIRVDPVERIMMDYRNAGEDRRLDLFLAYRDLRDRFREIERSDCSAAPGVHKKFTNVPVLGV